MIGGTDPPGVLQPLFGDNPDPYRLLFFIVGFGFLISTASHGVRVIGDYVNAKIEQNIILDLRSDLFNHVTQLSLTYHDERHTGMLMGLINMQASSLGAIVMSFPPIFEGVLMLIGMLTIALLIDWQVTLRVARLRALHLLGDRPVWDTHRPPYPARAEPGAAIAVDRVRGDDDAARDHVVRPPALEHYRFLTQGKTAVDARVRLTVHQTMFSLGVATAIALGTAIVLGFGAYHVLQGNISLGEMIVLISYIASVYQPLEAISQTIGNLHQSFVFLNASFTILAEKPEVIEKPDAIDIGRSSGASTFENVSFSYKGRQGTLRNVSFSCKGGDRVAVVGPTGAGKTTLMNILVRFYDPAEGTRHDRRPRHQGPDARLPARADEPRDADTAPVLGLDRRQHPLWQARLRRWTTSWPLPRRPTATTSSRACPVATRPSWARGARSCPAASVSGSRWPARSSGRLRSSSWTSRPRRSTPRPRP